MYKFTNGIVVYDKETKEKYIKCGYKLVASKTKKIIEEKTNETNSSKSIPKKHTGSNNPTTEDKE